MYMFIRIYMYLSEDGRIADCSVIVGHSGVERTLSSAQIASLCEAEADYSHITIRIRLYF